jgi:hypothetical protein
MAARSNPIASDLQVSLPTLNRRTPAVVAARLFARGSHEALVVSDDDGAPAAVISAPDVLGILVASEPAEEGADTTIGDLLDDSGTRVAPIVRVDADASLLEIAACMADARTPIAVVDGDPRAPRFIPLALVLDAVLAARGHSDPAD